jgi:hypothetical protein
VNAAGRQAAAFMDANECNTMIAAARNSTGNSTKEILAAMVAAAGEFGKNVMAKLARKGERS